MKNPLKWALLMAMLLGLIGSALAQTRGPTYNYRRQTIDVGARIGDVQIRQRFQIANDWSSVRSSDTYVAIYDGNRLVTRLRYSDYQRDRNRYDRYRVVRDECPPAYASPRYSPSGRCNNASYYGYGGHAGFYDPNQSPYGHKTTMQPCNSTLRNSTSRNSAGRRR
ncbi:hypothetical protein JNK13_06930 [bacterium]|nr:hypothetical protein [bacterium]